MWGSGLWSQLLTLWKIREKKAFGRKKKCQRGWGNERRVRTVESGGVWRSETWLRTRNPPFYPFPILAPFPPLDGELGLKFNCIVTVNGWKDEWINGGMAKFQDTHFELWLLTNYLQSCGAIRPPGPSLTPRGSLIPPATFAIFWGYQMLHSRNIIQIFRALISQLAKLVCCDGDYNGVSHLVLK